MDSNRHNASVAPSPAARVIAIVVCALPLVFDPVGLYPFGPAKWVVVTGGLLVASALVLRRPQVQVHRATTIGWGGFLAWAAVSASTGVDPIHAWIGTPERRLGVLALVLFGLAFVVGQNLATDRAWLVRSVSVSLAGVGLFAVAEMIGFTPVDLVTTSTRVGGSFGSPAYLGAACVLLIPTAVGVAFDVSQPKPWRSLATVAAALGLVALLGSQARAALIGLAAGVLVPMTLIRRGRLAVGVGMVLLVTAVLFTPAGQRLLEVSDLASTEARSRLDEWRIGWRALVSDPLSGTGPEGYRIVFPLMVDAEYERQYGREFAPDRAHNGFLDAGIALGLPGAAFYVSAAVFLVVRALRCIRGGDPGLIGIAAGVMAYLVQQQFLFPLVEVDPIFWILAGLLVVATNRGEPIIRWRASSLVAGSCATLALIAVAFGALELMADRRAAEAYRLLGLGDATGALAVADAAVDLRPDSIRYWFVAADVASRPGTAAGFEAALERTDRALTISPDDPIVVRTRSRLLLDRAQATVSRADLDLALTSLFDLIDRDPNNAGHRLLLGVALLMDGNPSAAELEWLQAQALAPDSAVPSMNLARLYLNQGRPGDAKTFYLRALALDPQAVGLAELANLLLTAGVEVPIP